MSAHGRFARAGILFPLFLIAVTTVYLAAAFGIRTQFTGDGEIGPRTIPILAAVLMYAALFVVLVQEVMAGAPPREEGDTAAALLRPAIVLVATGAYIFLFRPLGYCISTLLFVSALFVTFQFETRRPLFFALYAVGVTAAFYGLFALIFGVRLPALTGGII